MSASLPHLPAVSAMSTAIEESGVPPIIARRRAIRLLNALYEQGWALELTAAGEAQASRHESLEMAVVAEAEGDLEDAAWFRRFAGRTGS